MFVGRDNRKQQANNLTVKQANNLAIKQAKQCNMYLMTSKLLPNRPAR
jgi:hypothetical protein